MRKGLILFVSCLLCLGLLGCEKRISESDLLGTWQAEGLKYTWSEGATAQEQEEARAQLKKAYPNATTDEELLKACAQAGNDVLRANPVTYTLRTDGCCVYSDGSSSKDYTWKIKDNKLYITSCEEKLDVGYETMEFIPEGDTLLSVTDSAGLYSVVTFIKK